MSKILIIGTSASGKSTFARELARKMDLPIFHADAIMWNPGWVYIGDEQTNVKIKEIIDQEKWILEGWIDKKVQLDVFTKADLIIYLNFSPFVTSWRYIKRYLAHRTHPRPELPGSPEKFSFEFLWRVFKRKEMYWVDRNLRNIEPAKVTYLDSPKDAEDFILKYKNA